MFDPTAFENIKVVLEGEIYDRDLSGEIFVSDRNDWMNMAKLSRKYEISFKLSDSSSESSSATLVLEAGAENLCAEVMGLDNARQLAGCHVHVCFTLLHEDEETVYQRIQNVLEAIWGVNRAIEQIPQNPVMKKRDIVQNEITVKFDRLVYEDQMEDLSELVEYMIFSLKSLDQELTK